MHTSTEHQQYSTANQQDAVAEYARRGFGVVRTYADEGHSGLTAAGRDAVRAMIADVEGERAECRAILVYDVGRWPVPRRRRARVLRVPVRRAGIEGYYCAEQFDKDGGPTATITKSVKRAMAGAYSRKLSAEVFRGQCRLVELGYRQGGPPGYGLRRMLINRTGERKGVLAGGEQKSLPADRVILTPGPEEEQEVLRWVCRRFTRESRRESEIATDLNARDLRTNVGRPWTRAAVRQVPTNEKYIGNNVYNRTSFKLKKRRGRNTPDMWIRAEAAFPSVVSPEDFFVARGTSAERPRRAPTEDMIAHPRRLAGAVATVSAGAIGANENMPSSAAYRSRFGTLLPVSCASRPMPAALTVTCRAPEADGDLPDSPVEGRRRRAGQRRGRGEDSLPRLFTREVVRVHCQERSVAHRRLWQSVS